MKTKCIIVDDEPIARDVIRTHLGNFKDFEIVAECENAVEALEVISKKSIDLVFLDIQMPKISGIDFLKSVNPGFKTILTTAFRDYALEGYQLDVVDYLLKPVSFERFIKAIDKFLQQSQSNIIQFKEETKLDETLFIYIKEGKETHKIYLKDILYIESLREYLIIHLVEKSIQVIYRIGEFEEKLPRDYFVRIHKSYIVSLKRITSFTSNMIKINEIQLPIGRTYAEILKEKLGHNL